MAWEWTEQLETAAHLIAMGEDTYPAIAEKVGVSRGSLYLWRRRPDFVAKVNEHLDAHKEAVLSHGIAQKINRIEQQNERWMELRRIVRERAASPGMRNVDGGTTGMVVHKRKAIGSGESIEFIDEYELDVPLLKEIREHEKLAATELGQWKDTGKDDTQATLLEAIQAAEAEDSKYADSIATTENHETL